MKLAAGACTGNDRKLAIVPTFDSRRASRCMKTSFNLVVIVIRDGRTWKRSSAMPCLLEFLTVDNYIAKSNVLIVLNMER